MNSKEKSKPLYNKYSSESKKTAVKHARPHKAAANNPSKKANKKEHKRVVAKNIAASHVAKPAAVNAKKAAD